MHTISSKQNTKPRNMMSHIGQDADSFTRRSDVDSMKTNDIDRATPLIRGMVSYTINTSFSSFNKLIVTVHYK